MMDGVPGPAPDWRQWEGEIVDGEFPLEEFLGAGAESAVFRTRLPSGDGAIKLVLTGEVHAARLIEQWNRAGALSHPHLIRIFSTGIWTKAGRSLAYLVMEYAEENLASVLLERGLTSDEALEMLEPMAEALAFLHDQGLVHGRLKPSNVLAVQDALKISSDTISAGESGADLRALAATLLQALTQQPVTLTKGDSGKGLSKPLRPPFDEIVRNCVGGRGQEQWSAADLAGWLKSRRAASAAMPAPAAPVIRKSRLNYYVIVLALLAVAAVTFGLLRERGDRIKSSPAQPVTSPAETAPSGSKAASVSSAEPPPAKAVNRPPINEARDQRAGVRGAGPVLREVLPEIPAKARRTVHGRARVVVRVAVNPSGDVTDAVLETGGSRYFGKLALEAARKWRFAVQDSAATQEWLLRFEITRADTKVYPKKLVER
jgi:TonB family protein